MALVQPADDATPGPDLARDALPRTPTGTMVEGRRREAYAAAR